MTLPEEELTTTTTTPESEPTTNSTNIATINATTSTSTTATTPTPSYLRNVVPVVDLSDLTVRVFDITENRLIPGAKVKSGYIHLDDGNSYSIKNLDGMFPVHSVEPINILSFDLDTGMTSLVNIESGKTLETRHSSEGIPEDQMSKLTGGVLIEILLGQTGIHVDTYNGRWTVQDTETGELTSVSDIKNGVIYLDNGVEVHLPSATDSNGPLPITIAINTRRGVIETFNSETGKIGSAYRPGMFDKSVSDDNQVSVAPEPDSLADVTSSTIGSNYTSTDGESFVDPEDIVTSLQNADKRTPVDEEDAASATEPGSQTDDKGSETEGIGITPGIENISTVEADYSAVFVDNTLPNSVSEESFASSEGKSDLEVGTDSPGSEHTIADILSVTIDANATVTTSKPIKEADVSQTSTEEDSSASTLVKVEEKQQGPDGYNEYKQSTFPSISSSSETKEENGIRVSQNLTDIFNSTTSTSIGAKIDLPETVFKATDNLTLKIENDDDNNASDAPDYSVTSSVVVRLSVPLSSMAFSKGMADRCTRVLAGSIAFALNVCANR